MPSPSHLMSEDHLPVPYPRLFPPELRKHCEASFIPPELFRDIAAVCEDFPRYVRLHPVALNEWGTDDPEQLALRLDEEIAGSTGRAHWVTAAAVPWLPCFAFAVPRALPVHSLPAYQAGMTAAMDAGSMAVVAALRPRVGDRVLDVCCSPGMKLNLIADAVGATGLAVGVDISLQRLFVARAQVLKHRLPYLLARSAAVGAAPTVGLFMADGRTVSTHALIADDVLDSAAQQQQGLKVGAKTGLTAREEQRLKRHLKRPRQAGSAPSCASSLPAALAVYAPQAARHALTDDSWRDKLYDRVLVDAECSHDGSLAHMDIATSVTPNGVADSVGISNTRRMERMNIAAAEAEDRPRPPNEELEHLQLNLLRNGYQQLRPGGTLVYSTCSFSFWQNEYIVHRFLQLASETESDTTAVLCDPFSFEYDEVAGAPPPPRPLAPCMRNEDALQGLRARVEASKDAYHIVSNGSQAIGAAAPLFIGARLYPCDCQTSFQYMAKIWKRPAAPSMRACPCAPHEKGPGQHG